MAENKITVVDPMVAFVDLEGDPEAEIAKSVAERKAKGLPDRPPEGELDAVEPQGKDEPQIEVTVEADGGDEGPEGDDDDIPSDTPEVKAATTLEVEPAEKPQKRPWERVKEMRKELKEERRAREVLEAKLAQIEARQQGIDQQRAEYLQQGQRALEEQQRQAQPPPEPIPAYEDDPLAHNRMTIERLQARVEQAEKQTQQTTQQTMIQQVVQRIDAEERGFAQTTPDYYDARNHLVQREWQQAKSMGLNDDEARYALEVRRQTLVAAAWRQGKSVAQLAYEMAQASGYARQVEVVSTPKPQGDAAKERVQQATARERQANASLANIPSAGGHP